MKSGFSLIEVIVVTAILGILSVAGVTSFTASIERTRDARRKADLGTIQKAVEAYYGDNALYPASITAADLCASAANCYLRTIPTDPAGGSYAYHYVRGNTSGTSQSYQLYSTLERTDDTGTGVNQGGYAGTCGGTCKYGVSSPNTTP